MKKYILDYVCKLEGRKTQIKELHWSASNLPEHQLCDEIAEKIAEFQDKVSEVEQGISGRFKRGNLNPVKGKTPPLKKFIEEVISDANEFHNKLEKEGDTYKGMKSDAESFISDMQRLLYLADFTVKESLKYRLRDRIKENRIEISDGFNLYSLTENELRELVSESIRIVKRKNGLK